MAADGSNPTRIMIAVSASKIYGYPHASISSKGAFEWTVKKIIRSNTSGFKLLFLHVTAHDDHVFGDKSRAAPRLLEYFVKKCQEIGVASEAWIKKGDAKEIICHEAKRLQPDFLVVGSRGLGPFQKALAGTVSEFCRQHADCPVIAIKRAANEIPKDPCSD